VRLREGCLQFTNHINRIEAVDIPGNSRYSALQCRRLLLGNGRSFRIAEPTIEHPSVID
jgi:hypothetical protein